MLPALLIAVLLVYGFLIHSIYRDDLRSLAADNAHLEAQLTAAYTELDLHHQWGDECPCCGVRHGVTR